MTGLRVIYGLFCARHRIAMFIRSTDESARDYAFTKKHEGCRPRVVIDRWVLR